MELRDDDNVPLPWERRRQQQNARGGGSYDSDGDGDGGGEAGMMDTPLHANTVVSAATQSNNVNVNINEEQKLPAVVLQKMLKYDDDEFVSAANTILEHIQWKQMSEMDAKINAMMALSVGDVGDNGNTNQNNENSVTNLADDLGQDFIDGFLSALDYRLERLSNDTNDGSLSYYVLHPEQIEMYHFIKEVQNVIDKNAAYFVPSRTPEQQSDEEDPSMSTAELSGLNPGMESSHHSHPRPGSEFMPHSVAGYVPLTPRSKHNADEQEQDQLSISIAKSFENTTNKVKSSYNSISKKVEETLLKSISRDEGKVANSHEKSCTDDNTYTEANSIVLKEEQPVAYGRYVDNGNDDASRQGDKHGQHFEGNTASSSKAKMFNQSERRQALISEIQRLQSLMDKASMHREVQDSCKH